MRISEAQAFVKEILEKHNIKKAPLASLAGVLEELGELASTLLVKEGFKAKLSEIRLDYRLAETFFELLKLAEDCGVNLEKTFIKALESWKSEKPRWL